MAPGTVARMSDLNSAAPLRPLHRLWRLLPARRRRDWLTRGAALLAPRPDRPPPPPAGGVVVAGELARASGLGEAARLTERATAGLGVPHLAGRYRRGAARRGAAIAAAATMRAAGAPLLLHVNAPMLPLALLRLPRGLARGAAGDRLLGLGIAGGAAITGGPGSASCMRSGRPSRFTAAAFRRRCRRDRVVGARRAAPGRGRAAGSGAARPGRFRPAGGGGGGAGVVQPGLQHRAQEPARRRRRRSAPRSATGATGCCC